MYRSTPPTCASYWRTALADAELGRGAFQKKDTAGFETIERADLFHGRVGPKVLDNLFRGEHAEAEGRDVLLRPLVYQARVEHGQQRATLPYQITPIVSRAIVLRDGGLKAMSKTVVPRDLLRPHDRDAFTIGDVEALDRFLASDMEAENCADDWQAYERFCDRLIKAVLRGLKCNDGFERVEGGYLKPADLKGDPARNIIALYDRLVERKPDVSLFKTFASKSSQELEVCLPPHDRFAARLGHPNPNHGRSLADSQRVALAHLLAAGHGEVVAVNGPPGTGKTTLLLSVVASLRAKAALDGGEPPIVLAASTNNQAVTNIIDAFGKDFARGEGPFAGRWLPEVSSFGGYFPAEYREKEARKKYQTQAFFDRVEDPGYAARARDAYLQAAYDAFPDLRGAPVIRVVEALHTKLRAQADTLVALETSWAALAEARERVRGLLGHDPAGTLARRRSEVGDAKAGERRANALAEAWDRHHGGEPVLHALFGWWPAIGRRRLSRARSALRSHWLGPLPKWQRFEEAGSAVSAVVDEARGILAEKHALLAEAEDTLEVEQECFACWREALGRLGDDAADLDLLVLADCDPLADRLLRFPIFLTTTHYWEGKWLLAMEGIANPADEKRRAGRTTVIPRWRRRMMLTPCAVSTFHMLPKLLGVRQREGEGYVDDYLYDTADLLIVDEAGQVAPEVAGASFALAKKALVIGDTEQIEPIWNITPGVDIGNLRKAGLLAAGDERIGRNPFADSGRAAASGSVMQVAQHVSRHHQDKALARGLVLHEHYRCLDEIIAYPNELCYKGRLKPMRGDRTSARDRGEHDLPPLGHLHVDGRCETSPGGSRRNLTEAETIDAWLAEQGAMLQEAYQGRALGDVVGIVTPFRAQARAIEEALRCAKIEAGPGKTITVGTVHAFQGGQKPVMLFSPTYSKHDDGPFIDKNNSMLNVAVSRAKDSFLVFGDMDCFSAARHSSPRGLLGRRLFADTANMLPFEQAPRRDLMGQKGVQHLHDAEEHDAFLRDVLKQSRHEVHVVSPLVTRRAVQGFGLIPAIEAAGARGVRITVYTDEGFNAERAGRGRGEADDFAAAITALRAAGADTIVLDRVHSKIVMADNDLYCVGSFNWLGAARRGASYVRHETSMVYRGPAVAGEIGAMKDSLDRRRFAHHDAENGKRVGVRDGEWLGR